MFIDPRTVKLSSHHWAYILEAVTLAQTLAPTGNSELSKCKRTRLAMAEDVLRDALDAPMQQHEG